MKLTPHIDRKNRRKDGSYPVIIRIFHNGQYGFVNTGYTAFEKELKQDLTIKDRALQRRVENKMHAYEDALAKVEIAFYSAKDLAKLLMNNDKGDRHESNTTDLVPFIREQIQTLKSKGKIEHRRYNTLLLSLIDFTGRNSIFVTEITTSFLQRYADYLRSTRLVKRVNQGVLRTIELPPCGEHGLYNILKDLRTIHNRYTNTYERDDLPYPFRKFKLKQPATKPRSCTDEQLMEIYRMDNFSRDMYFLSFFLAGINAIDLLKLPKDSLQDGRLNYNRSKTKDRRQDKAFLSIRVEPEAMELIEKYKGTQRLLNLYVKYSNSDTLNRAINRHLPVNFYSARHTWATIARNKCGISKDDISLALNHSDQEYKTTDIYIARDFSAVDRANRAVIDYLIGLSTNILLA